MTAFPVTLMATALLVFGGRSMDAHAATKPLTLCTMATEVDLDPFKPIGDGSRHSMLDIFTRDYLSEDPNFPGLLDAFNFSADGKTFTGRVALDAKWRDGTPLSAFEAALGIAKGLTHRPAHPNIRVLGTEKINEPGWEARTYTGIRILDARKFEIDFDTATPVENRVGVIRELLSSGELSNRVWPARVGVKTAPGDLPDVVSHYGVRGDKDHPILRVGPHEVKIQFGGNCKDSDLTSPFANSTYRSIYDYDVVIGKNEMVLEVYLNPKRQGLSSPESRLEVVGWMRGAVAPLAHRKEGRHVPKAHFLADESGYQEGFSWPSSGSIVAFSKVRKDVAILLPNRSMAKNPLLVNLSQKFAENGVAVKWLSREDPVMSADIILQPASNKGKRQVWLQKVLSTPLNSTLIQLYPGTKQVLQQITKRSASTIPVDAALLTSFENESRREISIVPLFRYAVATMSKKSSPVEGFDGIDGRMRLRRKDGH